MSEVKAPHPRPCETCPYRRDVPSGIWDEAEYRKLPAYDNDTPGQPAGLFMCHQGNGHVCSGWAGCHDMHHALAIRFASRDTAPEVIEEILNYRSPVPLFASGTAAAEHGLADVVAPQPEAQQAIAKLVRQRGI